MDEKEIQKIIEEEGFTAGKLIDTSELVFRHEYRKYCEMNSCGNYGKNYGCPPYCGTPEEMERKAIAFKKALVFQTREQVADIFDDALTKEIKKVHTRKTFHGVRLMQEKGLDKEGLYAMCGPCGLCSQCKMLLGEPCAFPGDRTSCLSAYCIDVNELASSCGMNIDWQGNMVSFFSIYFFEKNK